MTNFEKFKDTILKLCNEGINISVVAGKPVNCDLTECKFCDLEDDNDCNIQTIKWLYEECK